MIEVIMLMEFGRLMVVLGQCWGQEVVFLVQMVAEVGLFSVMCCTTKSNELKMNNMQLRID